MPRPAHDAFQQAASLFPIVHTEFGGRRFSVDIINQVDKAQWQAYGGARGGLLANF